MDHERWREVEIWPHEAPVTSSKRGGASFRRPIHAAVIDDFIIVADNAAREMILCNLQSEKM